MTGQDFPETLVAFQSAGAAFALDARIVLKVVPAYAVAPLPGAPSTVLGLAVFAGQPLPVLDAAALFRPPAAVTAAKVTIPGATLRPTARFLLIRCPGVSGTAPDAMPRQLFLHADAVQGVCPKPAMATLPETIGLGMARLRGIGHGAEGMIYIFDPEKLLTAQEADHLDLAVQGATA